MQNNRLVTKTLVLISYLLFLFENTTHLHNVTTPTAAEQAVVTLAPTLLISETTNEYGTLIATRNARGNLVQSEIQVYEFKMDATVPFGHWDCEAKDDVAAHICHSDADATYGWYTNTGHYYDDNRRILKNYDTVHETYRDSGHLGDGQP